MSDTAAAFAALKQEIERYHIEGIKDVNIGERVQAYRLCLGLNKSQLAKCTQVTPTTINRWESNEAVPEIHRLNQFETLLHGHDSVKLEVSARSSTLATKAKVSTSQLTPLPSPQLGELLALQAEAKAVWIAKSSRPFLVANSIPARNEYIQNLKRGIEYNFIFPVLMGFTEQDKTAQNSFNKFKEFLDTYHNDLVARVKSWAVADYKAAYNLGLSKAVGSWVVIEYPVSVIKQRNTTYDMFVEIRNPSGDYEWYALFGDDADLVWNARDDYLSMSEQYLKVLAPTNVTDDLRNVES